MGDIGIRRPAHGHLSLIDDVMPASYFLSVLLQNRPIECITYLDPCLRVDPRSLSLFSELQANAP